ncbi:MAG: hypothetical protein ACXWMS_03055 [Syntrophales bacterium]
MPESDIEFEEFECSKIGAEVTITRQVFLHRNALTDKVDGRAVVDVDCDHNLDCGVGERDGVNTIYDWNKCVHKDLRERNIRDANK